MAHKYDDIANARKFDTPLNIIELIEERIKLGDLDGLKKILSGPDKTEYIHCCNVMSMNVDHPKIREVCIWLIENDLLCLPYTHCYTSKVGKLFVEHASEATLLEDIDNKVKYTAKAMYTNLEIMRNAAIQRRMPNLFTKVSNIQTTAAEQYLQNERYPKYESEIMRLVCEGDLEGIKRLVGAQMLQNTNVSILPILPAVVEHQINNGPSLNYPNAADIRKWALQETSMPLSIHFNLDDEILSYISEYKLTDYVWEKYLKKYNSLPENILRCIFERKMYELTEFIFRYLRYHTPNCGELLYSRMSDALIKIVVDTDDMRLIKLCIRYIKNFDISCLTLSQIERY